ncbi:MAG TPA: hypothetical protein ACFYD2_11565, partial [Candidatus Avalokitesvara rifleensis]|uniref:hypothetical protein n=1 Tax=Candidatus Avalokitesvara rifleensis TaxID=3367620 RepID=UPI00271277B9|nr:hypothetical protein [Candidatus Brocadiales bacterium]
SGATAASGRFAPTSCHVGSALGGQRAPTIRSFRFTPRADSSSAGRTLRMTDVNTGEVCGGFSQEN